MARDANSTRSYRLFPYGFSKHTFFRQRRLSQLAADGKRYLQGVELDCSRWGIAKHVVHRLGVLHPLHQERDRWIGLWLCLL